MTLEEATVSDIWAELKRRFPSGVVLLGLSPHRGNAGDEKLYEDRPFVAWNGAWPCLGLLEVAQGRIKLNLHAAMSDSEDEGDGEEGEDGGEG